MMDSRLIGVWKAKDGSGYIVYTEQGDEVIIDHINNHTWTFPIHPSTTFEGVCREWDKLS